MPGATSPRYRSPRGSERCTWTRSVKGTEKLTVLVVDDDDAQRALLRHQLVRAGFDVIEAPDGKVATRVLLSQGPQLVVTDWDMPEMDGLDLCRLIRAHEAIGFTYVVMITSDGDESRLLAAFKAGADDFLVKPYNHAVNIQ